MLGNDIIDLEETKRTTNWQRPGFLDKVFSQTEQAEIKKSKTPFELVWRLWSMKESAYKISIKYGYERSFKPASILCNLLTKKKGWVTIGALTLETETKMNVHYIFTVASVKNIPSISSTILKIQEHNRKAQRNTIYNAILKQVALETECEKNQLNIGKTSENIPYISYKNKQLEKSVSISHHGKYGLFSLQNM